MDTPQLPGGLEDRIKIAEYIVSNAGSLITDLFHRALRTEEKATNDFASELDRNIESMALKAVLEKFPQDGFYGEENVGVESKNGVEWIVDPIDGTNNYLRGLPICGFQLAILYNREPVYGIIHRPLTKETYFASKGQGAHYYNEYTGKTTDLKVSDRDLSQAIAIFDAHVGKKHDDSTEVMRLLADKINNVRVFGAAVFDLPSVAEGSAEILVSGIAKPYDIAAGKLLIEEAGGTAYSTNGADVALEDTLVIFSSQKLRPLILQELSDPSVSL